MHDWLEDRCRAAGLTRLQETVILLRYADRRPPSLVFRAVEGMRADGRAVRRQRDVFELLREGETKLSRLPGFWREAREFPGVLLQAASNRKDYDDRPPGVSGVTPAPASKRFQGMPVLSEDDRRLRQSRRDALRLWLAASAAAELNPPGPDRAPSCRAGS